MNSKICLKIILFQERETNWKFYRLLGATFYDWFNTIYQFIIPFWDNKMSIFESYGVFKPVLEGV